MLDHKDTLNEMLSNACPARENGNVVEFHLDMHCVRAVVTALSHGYDENKGYATYDIIKVEWESI